MKNIEIHTELLVPKILVGLIILLSSQVLSAQDYVDIIKLNYNQSSKTAFVTTGATNKTNINEIDLDVNVPIKLKQHFALLTGLNYEYFSTSLDTQENKKSLYSFGLKLGLNTIINSHWSLNTIVIPKFSGVANNIRSHDLQMGLYSLAKYRQTNQIQYKFGLYVNKEFFGPWIVPILGLYYLSKNNKFEINANLPINVEANYKINTHWLGGLYYTGLTKSYHVNDAYLVRSGSEINATLKYKISQTLYIQGRFGRSLGRKYQLYNENDQVKFGSPIVYLGDDRTVLNHLFKNAWVYQLQLFLRIDVNKTK